MLSSYTHSNPRTPSSSSPYRPHTSSPLSESFSPSPSTSAAAKLRSRRLAQYKSTDATPTRRVSNAYNSGLRRAATDVPGSGVGLRLFSPASAPGDAEDRRSTLLRDRLRQRCAREAQQARTKRVERERRRKGLSSDGEDMCMESDEEVDEEVLINDELFHRIVASASRKQHYSYRLSFQDEVGSSLDPDMEDITEWERFLHEGSPDDPDLPPSELDEEEIAELAAEAEEAELWGDLDSSDKIFEFSSTIDIDPKLQAIQDDDVTMA